MQKVPRNAQEPQIDAFAGIRRECIKLRRRDTSQNPSVLFATKAPSILSCSTGLQLRRTLSTVGWSWNAVGRRDVPRSAATESGWQSISLSGSLHSIPVGLLISIPCLSMSSKYLTSCTIPTGFVFLSRVNIQHHEARRDFDWHHLFTSDRSGCNDTDAE